MAGGLLAPPALIGLAAAAPAQAAGSSCGGLQGPYQKQAEQFLGLKADGVQTTADCEAIRSFQAVHGIQPQYGYAGPTTWKVMQGVERLEAAAQDPNKDGKCPEDRGRIACVDMTRQISWIQDGGELRMGPVPVRTGRNGHETRTGAYKIYWRNRHHVSSLYESKMPYSQFFDGGEAFHAISGSVWSEPGSHGCVNMRTEDAKAYWDLLQHGDDVFVYGRKPGT